MVMERSGRPVLQWAACLAGTAALAGLTACDLVDPGPGPSPSTDQSGSPSADASAGGEDEATGTGPVELAEPLEFAIVEEAGQPPCVDDQLADEESGECLLLGERIEVSELDQLELVDADSSPDPDVLQLTLADQDAEAFYDLTARAMAMDSPRIAVVVDGEVASSPALGDEIPGGLVQISGWADAEEFVAEATGAS